MLKSFSRAEYQAKGEDNVIPAHIMLASNKMPSKTYKKEYNLK